MDIFIGNKLALLLGSSQTALPSDGEEASTTTECDSYVPSEGGSGRAVIILSEKKGNNKNFQLSNGVRKTLEEWNVSENKIIFKIDGREYSASFAVEKEWDKLIFSIQFEDGLPAGILKNGVSSALSSADADKIRACKKAREEAAAGREDKPRTGDSLYRPDTESPPEKVMTPLELLRDCDPARAKDLEKRYRNDKNREMLYRISAVACVKEVLKKIDIEMKELEKASDKSAAVRRIETIYNKFSRWLKAPYLNSYHDLVRNSGGRLIKLKEKLQKDYRAPAPAPAPAPASVQHDAEPAHATAPVPSREQASAPPEPELHFVHIEKPKKTELKKIKEQPAKPEPSFSPGKAGGKYKPDTSKAILRLTPPDEPSAPGPTPAPAATPAPAPAPAVVTAAAPAPEPAPAVAPALAAASPTVPPASAPAPALAPVAAPPPASTPAHAPASAQAATEEPEDIGPIGADPAEIEEQINKLTEPPTEAEINIAKGEDLQKLIYAIGDLSEQNDDLLTEIRRIADESEKERLMASFAPLSQRITTASAKLISIDAELTSSSSKLKKDIDSYLKSGEGVVANKDRNELERIKGLAESTFNQIEALMIERFGSKDKIQHEVYSQACKTIGSIRALAIPDEPALSPARSPDRTNEKIADGLKNNFYAAVELCNLKPTKENHELVHEKYKDWKKEIAKSHGDMVSKWPSYYIDDHNKMDGEMQKIATILADLEKKKEATDVDKIWNDFYKQIKGGISYMADRVRLDKDIESFDNVIKENKTKTVITIEIEYTEENIRNLFQNLISIVKGSSAELAAAMLVTFSNKADSTKRADFHRILIGTPNYTTLPSLKMSKEEGLKPNWIRLYILPKGVVLLKK